MSWPGIDREVGNSSSCSSLLRGQEAGLASRCVWPLSQSSPCTFEGQELRDFVSGEGERRREKGREGEGREDAEGA